MNIVDKLIGKKIVEIITDRKRAGEYGLDLQYNDTYIVLDDGSIIKIWVSEWGSIEELRKEEEIGEYCSDRHMYGYDYSEVCKDKEWLWEE